MGDIRFSTNATKIFRIKGSLIGVAGSCALTQKLINHLKESQRDPVAELSYISTTFDGINVLILNKGGMWGYDGQGHPYPIKEKASACGSGYIPATAALMCGKSPQDAVRIAIKLDTKSGGRMKYVKL